MKKWLLILGLVSSTAFGEPSRLMEAIANKEPFETIQQLVNQGEDVNDIDMEFLRCLKPVLRYALDRGTDQESVAIIRMLIAAGANEGGCPR